MSITTVLALCKVIFHLWFRYFQLIVFLESKCIIISCGHKVHVVDCSVSHFLSFF